MNKALYLLALCCIFILPGCKYNTEWHTVKAGNDFTLSLPPWLDEADNLKQGAALQYSSRYRNFYVIGEAASGTKPATDVVREHITRLKKSMTNPLVTDSTTISVDGLSGSRVEVFGKMTDENIYFSEMLLEGKGKHYHISVWTRGEDRKLRYKEDINKILTSFKVL